MNKSGYECIWVEAKRMGVNRESKVTASDRLFVCASHPHLEPMTFQEFVEHSKKVRKRVGLFGGSVVGYLLNWRGAETACLPIEVPKGNNPTQSTQ